MYGNNTIQNTKFVKRHVAVASETTAIKLQSETVVV